MLFKCFRSFNFLRQPTVQLLQTELLLNGERYFNSVNCIIVSVNGSFNAR